MAVATAAEAAAARAGARKKFRARGPTWVELTERGKTTFTLQDAEEITGLRGSSVRTLIHKAERRGLFTRLRSGLDTLVPFEMGRATEYVGDPYVIAREMCEGRPSLSLARLRDGTAPHGYTAAVHQLCQLDDADAAALRAWTRVSIRHGVSSVDNDFETFYIRSGI